MTNLQKNTNIWKKAQNKSLYIIHGSHKSRQPLPVAGTSIQIVSFHVQQDNIDESFSRLTISVKDYIIEREGWSGAAVKQHQVAIICTGCSPDGCSCVTTCTES